MGCIFNKSFWKVFQFSKGLEIWKYNLLTCNFLLFLWPKLYRPSKHCLFSKTFSRHLEDVFSVTLFVFQDLLKTSSRRLQDLFTIRLPKTSSRRFPKTSLRRFQDIFKMSSKTSSRRVCKTSSRNLQDVLEDKKLFKSSGPQVFLGKGVLNICSKFTGDHPCRSAISIKLLCNFIEIALRHGWSLVNWLHIFRTPFPKNHLWMTASECYPEDVLKTSSRRLQYVFTKTNICCGDFKLIILCLNLLNFILIFFLFS